MPVLALALARAQQHVRVPGLAVFLLLSVAQAATCVALLHASLSFYLARGSRPNRWLVAAAVALTPAGLLAGAAAFPAFTRIAAGQIPVSAWAAVLFCGALTAALTPLLSLPALVAVVLAGAAAIGAWPASTGGAGGSGPAFAAGGPDDLRTRFTRHTVAALVAGTASLRPRPGRTIGYATRIALRELGRRAQFLDGQLERLDELIVPLVTARAPGLLALYGVGPDTAALLLVAAGDHPERLRSEAAWAHLCAAAPIPASSGKRTRHRLNPGGDRQANHALWRIVMTRMSSHPPTRAYVERRTAEGLSKAEIIRCLKRYAAREIYPRLRAAAD